jgi:uncharacterized membrane protein
MTAKPQSDAGPPPPVPEFIEALISRMLLAGVAASMAVVALGVAMMFVHHPEYHRQAADLARLTAPGAAFPHTPRDVLRGLVNCRGESIVALGLLLLIATPVLRVFVSIIGFAIKRDWTYTLVSAVVLIVLVLSFLLGKSL